MFIVKKHDSDPTSRILAVIDSDLKGKTITEGNHILDLTASFYNGEEKSEEETLALIKTASHLNAVGKNIIKLLKEEKYIEKTSEMNSVPYAQVAVVRN